MERLLMVSADNHVGAGPAAYLPYIEPKYRNELMELRNEEHDYLSVFIPFATFSDEALEKIDTRRAIRDGGALGALSTKARLKELDAEGVAAEIVHTGHQNAMTPWFSQINGVYPAEKRWIGARAYNRWLADEMAEGEGRVFGVAEPGPCLDMEATTKELEWCADHGFVSISTPGGIRNEPIAPLHDGVYDRFYGVCAERNIVLSIHAGWGAPQGSFFAFRDLLLKNPEITERVKKEGKAKVIGEIFRTDLMSPLALNIGPRRVFWQLMLGGVFDRHPELKLCLTEVRADWIPATLKELDREYDAGEIRVKMKPSEYFYKHVWVTPSSPRRNEIAERQAIGADHFMFGVDYPHSESTWPNTVDWIRDAFEGVPEADARKILGENAVECYKLPRDKLRQVAARIGLKGEDVFNASNRVAPEVLEHFSLRAGYDQPAETVDPQAVRAAVAEDAAALVAA
jgi:predicted TIM-barrel fold metal-dependent hydrolase